MLKFKLILLTSFVLTNLFGQKIEKVYLDSSDSTKNCYTVIVPSKLPWAGYLFLIPGFGESANEVMRQTDLPKQLALNGILTIIPTLQDGVLSFTIDSLSQNTFSKIVKDVIDKYKLAGQRFFIGGFSIGGSCAVKYAETAKIKPVAIFAIDPPLDFERFYNSAKRNVRLAKQGNLNQESVYMINLLEQQMKGTTQTALANYTKVSPYSFSDTSQAAIKNLVTTPIRIYSEPDINWWLNERGTDVTGMNVTDCSAMINELNKLGNANATLIITQNKGVRKPDNRRHPHSWSIVDNGELIKWLLKQK